MKTVSIVLSAVKKELMTFKGFWFWASLKLVICFYIKVDPSNLMGFKNHRARILLVMKRILCKTGT